MKSGCGGWGLRRKAYNLFRGPRRYPPECAGGWRRLPIRCAPHCPIHRESAADFLTKLRRCSSRCCATRTGAGRRTILGCASQLLNPKARTTLYSSASRDPAVAALLLQINVLNIFDCLPQESLSEAAEFFHRICGEKFEAGWDARFRRCGGLRQKLPQMRGYGVSGGLS
jgi:hypothetical protein